MRNSYRIDTANGIVYLTWAATNEFTDWVTLINDAMADPAFEIGFNFLSDRRAEAASEPPSTEDIKRFASFLAKDAARFGHCKIATVVSDPTTYGMVRMASVLAEQTCVELAVFTDYELALNWLR